MSRYFKPIEFKLEPDPGEPATPKTIIRLNPERLKVAVNTIEGEINKMKKGDSDFVSYAIHPGSFDFPAVNVLDELSKNPTIKNLNNFVQIATQDFGALAGKHFKALLVATKEEVPNV
jgi:hypothetical protein